MFPTHWCPRGWGIHGTPLKKTAFSSEFCDEYYTLYLYTKDNHIQATKLEENTVSKWGSNKRFLVRFHFDFCGKFVKTLSRRKFSTKFGSL